ncbi:MAG: hypothetical protein QOI44_2693 [Actinomycetota bacterium]|nr:hypothetical protein [Actinomycetota bacterium]
MRAARWASVVAVVLVLVGGACSSSSSSGGATKSQKVVWPAPADPMARARAAGLVPDTHETLVHHVHAHLDVFVNGEAVTVPAGIGINIHDPAVHSSDIAGAKAYGGIDPACKTACISPLHTHSVTGVLHTESPTVVDNTLGEFFTEWGVKLDAKCVRNYCKPATKIAIYVNGKPFTGDPRAIDLSDHKEIAIVIGTPPAEIPSTGDFSQP